MSLMSRNSPILSSLSARRKHHIHTAPTDDKNGTATASSSKRERPFGELKYDTEAPPVKAQAYKSIFSL